MSITPPEGTEQAAKLRQLFDRISQIHDYAAISDADFTSLFQQTVDAYGDQWRDLVPALQVSDQLLESLADGTSLPYPVIRRDMIEGIRVTTETKLQHEFAA